MGIVVHMKSRCWVFPNNLHRGWRRIMIFLGAILLISEVWVCSYSPRIQIQPSYDRKMRLRMSCILFAAVFQRSECHNTTDKTDLWQNHTTVDFNKLHCLIKQLWLLLLNTQGPLSVLVSAVLWKITSSDSSGRLFFCSFFFILSVFVGSLRDK